MSLVVMATGGTGGHIYPAVATAKELRGRGYEVALMGQKGGMEEGIAEREGLTFYGVDAGKLARSGQGRPDPRQLLKAGQGLAQARRTLAGLNPAAVVGYGGFASLPGVLAAQSLGIPTILHEQNARLGLTQRLAVRRARAVGTAYDKVIGLDPRKATLVGMPVREERMPRAEALAALGLRDGPITIMVMGGSQGSLYLNQQVPGILWRLFGKVGKLRGKGDSVPPIDLDLRGPHLIENARSREVQVLHATGPRWLAEVQPKVENLPWYHVTGYVDAVAAWSVADLGITRAGTGTLAEAAFHGVPLVMVPLPESAENHQYHNAVAVEQAGAGRVVEQKVLPETLEKVVLECAAPGKRAAMRDAAQKRARPGAAARFADLIEVQLRRAPSPTAHAPTAHD
ncbi:undecaprenyldiphospho-muramoylpentapeptide beta-N-acetylglucosaminyltransferase [Deinococcus radiodurans]|jgi:UDP-N-acetylglucosamine--N-acetylmuramyl-(pentapeptide) pyrophosphoryl-undecaprenol N-acetylglucosamine transferase (EC 2.4.1.227)|uniref:UDP-N-acetylglucosamine--N-acetylmuramyl-(pentapeptide) pyrophosphoryl-undecaprenol N-acetylglucosamine transferase n=1 Tax=Deinococcus radiodurans (strain ATCC 13939 / DSM 20539 / JCM 16871 / CCUG 27074 / LMG 4051 / NBRC 15346 / NCIMB 9279 / VKM B-1422 / R1) TaxID=243230 RepID=MURG_DEIRA|nr:undecaprenyldiphospho-muramoylpentapeptide beta-N-acetylglucosaminyltransferase [Deinococcus radiodurans]Q9RWP0.2 RecName: Full=UDP-N-acetylglucosamine--N-acetylmuramyl-(pentapeptide) pyrophosphoryl-undecaprenol N-acetylglucosamine transferase; AltName: Full=Undecaprenyl-PP-MurNAc-pentapeptide-UDPGlcNAc GlcNAc transferase [Deinococcus radiodurans R1 = ATCC 13939 = DSM 20539]ANC72136.1 UDP-N-acetylglucosamine--N-acetylmuramyl-(pentapeptide) pyrophosphoryl-undecaprenol N-acetylglucosamine transf